MTSAQPNGFSVGKCCGYTWDECESACCEWTRENGDVRYRGEYLCTMYNDADGGDIVGATGRHLSDATVQRKIAKIDRAKAVEK